MERRIHINSKKYIIPLAVHLIGIPKKLSNKLREIKPHKDFFFPFLFIGTGFSMFSKILVDKLYF